MPAHIVMFSSGIGSWAAAKRVAAEHGTKHMVLLFADVKGDDDADNSHIGEDEDNYRFLRDAADNVGAELVTVRDGRNIWQVFKDKRYLGNSRLANCSHLLKQVPCRKWIEANYPNPEDAILYLGIDWSESHRLTAIENNWRPYNVAAPLCDEPYLDKSQLLDWARTEGLVPPRLYNLGLPHSNCGGGCVRAGQAQFRKLLNVMPDRYAVWEQGESDMREYLNKDVAILRDHAASGRPLTLRAFRERTQDQPSLFDDLDWGGCGCFTEAD